MISQEIKWSKYIKHNCQCWIIILSIRFVCIFFSKLLCNYFIPLITDGFWNCKIFFLTKHLRIQKNKHLRIQKKKKKLIFLPSKCKMLAEENQIFLLVLITNSALKKLFLLLSDEKKKVTTSNHLFFLSPIFL